MTALDLVRQLPNPDVLRGLSKSLATLDLIMNPSWEGRYFSYDSTWGDREELASMRNGQGDEYSIVFAVSGVYVRGFGHECPISPTKLGGDLWPGLIESVPEDFREYVDEPSFSGAVGPLITVCLWWQKEGWRCGPIEFPESEDPDGADFLFSMVVDPVSERYIEFARSYYEVELDPLVVSAIYDGQPLTSVMVSALNAEVRLCDIEEELAEVDYPVESSPNR